MPLFQKLKNLTPKQTWQLLWIFITLHTLFTFLVCLDKYFNFGYNSLDLAIFNQVFFNSAEGQLFDFTIHPHSYLGDHLGLAALLILPLYKILPHPLTLLFIQTAILALTAWPIYLISRKILTHKWSLLLSLAWLFNPFVFTINLFEFHLLPLAIFLPFWTFYFYQNNRFRPFILFLTLSLLVREDVALVTIIFSVVALIDKKKWPWIVWPAVLSLGWFMAALKLINIFAPEGSYKFLVYYGWLGGSLSEIITNVFKHPWQVITRVVNFKNTLVTLMLLMPYGLLNLRRPKYLLFSLPIFAQLMLPAANNALVITKIHYTALLLPGLTLATIYGISAWLKKPFKVRSLATSLLADHKFIALFFVGAVVYSFLIIGGGQFFYKSKNISSNNYLKERLLSEIPDKANLAASYELLTNLSSRSKIYSLHYAYIGHKQFSDVPYSLPKGVQFLAIDFDDLITYSIHFPQSSFWGKYYEQGDNNIRGLFNDLNMGVKKITDTLILMENNFQSSFKLYETISQLPYNLQKLTETRETDVQLTGWQNLTDYQEYLLKDDSNLLPISLYFKINKKTDLNYQLNLVVKNVEGKIIHQKYYALAYGIYPTSEWQADEIIKTSYIFTLPVLSEEDEVYLEIVELGGEMNINHLGTVITNITESEVLTSYKLLP